MGRLTDDDVIEVRGKIADALFHISVLFLSFALNTTCNNFYDFAF
jgi:hypothetical protein